MNSRDGRAHGGEGEFTSWPAEGRRDKLREFRLVLYASGAPLSLYWNEGIPNVDASNATFHQSFLNLSEGGREKRRAKKRGTGLSNWAER